VARRSAKPNLAGVLASIVPGRVTRLALERDQKQALRDRDGQLALSVVRHLLGARAASVRPKVAPEPFPLTEEAFQAVAGRLGREVGIKRCRLLRRRLVAAGVLEGAGSYRQPYRKQAGGSGFRVRLYRLAVAIRRSALRRKRLSAGHVPSSPLPRVRWWQHPLFGDYEGRPPPQWTRRRRQQTASQDEYGAGVRLRPDCKPWKRLRVCEPRRIGA
jgi:hypothetical protein